MSQNVKLSESADLQKALERLYILNNQVLAQVDKATYLGVMILTEYLDWSPQINDIVTKANKCSSFINRNISDCPQTTQRAGLLILSEITIGICMCSI